MIEEVSIALQDILRKYLYPDYLLDMDGVKLCIPKHDEQDYQIGIYLYDVSEYSLIAQRYATIEDHTRVFPPKLMEISYLIFVNESVQFGGYDKLQEDRLYEKMIQIFHDESVLEVEGKQLPIHFENINLDNKIRLWQSLNTPLQPALYIKIAPVEIASGKQEQDTLVKDVNVDTTIKKT